MSRKQFRKQLASEILDKPISDLQEVLARYEVKDILSPLFSFICSTDEQLKWRAVTSFGLVISSLADTNMEAARIVMRRFLWTLNDESGGIGWGAPESMGEIMCNSVRLCDEYSHMLISYMRGDGEELHQDGNYLELPLLQQGLLWGIGRLCQVFPERMKESEIENDLIHYLHSEDMQVVGLALRCLFILGIALPDKYRKYVGCGELITVYEAGVVTSVPISDFVI